MPGSFTKPFTGTYICNGVKDYCVSHETVDSLKGDKHGSGVVEHACDPSTQEAEAG